MRIKLCYNLLFALGFVYHIVIEFASYLFLPCVCMSNLVVCNCALSFMDLNFLNKFTKDIHNKDFSYYI
jgi:hypothetical protein